MIRRILIAFLIICLLPITSAEARYYNAKTGRFLTRDGVDGDDSNRYSYVENDPINYIDPYGEMVVAPGGGLGIGDIGIGHGPGGIPIPGPTEGVITKSVSGPSGGYVANEGDQGDKGKKEEDKDKPKDPKPGPQEPEEPTAAGDGPRLCEPFTGPGRPRTA